MNSTSSHDNSFHHSYSPLSLCTKNSRQPHVVKSNRFFKTSSFHLNTNHFRKVKSFYKKRVESITVDQRENILKSPQSKTNIYGDNSKMASFPEEFETFEKTPLWVAIFTYFSYMILNLMGRLQDFLRRWNFIPSQLACDSARTSGFVTLYQDYEAFYTRNLYRRICDCWQRPLCSAPGANMELMDRESDNFGWSFRFTGGTTTCLNFGSYNYLGFAEPTRECSAANEHCIRKEGLALASQRLEVGNTSLICELEATVARFTGQEDACVFGMGFATNALNIPCLVDKHSCVISDELNHTSLILGMRLSGAQIRRFKHNDMTSLEQQLRDAILIGHPKTRRPFNKILIVVEGIYSMEGSIVRLPEVISLKKRYRAYLYLDEAHSIGALGSHGGGVVDYFGCNPRDVDVAMGTFTKSFGSAGGYIAGSRRLVDYIRAHSHSTVYAASMPPVVCQQVISVMNNLLYKIEGKQRIQRLAWNTRYLRSALHRMGMMVYGHRDSPVIPTIIFLPAKIASMSRECLKRGLGIVVVGFPATPLILGRARLCVSAGHTKEMLDQAISVLAEVSDLLGMRYSRVPPPTWTEKPMPPYPSIDWNDKEAADSQVYRCDISTDESE